MREGSAQVKSVPFRRKKPAAAGSAKGKFSKSPFLLSQGVCRWYNAKAKGKKVQKEKGRSHYRSPSSLL